MINDLDPDNKSAGRMWLAGPQVFGHGYGSEATRLVIDHALGDIGLHRLAVEVFDHNPRARRVYEKCGFSLEGRLRNALLWQGSRHDALVMAVLRTDEQARTGSSRRSVRAGGPVSIDVPWVLAVIATPD